MSLLRLINKTPLQNETSNVFEMNDLLEIKQILQSRFIGEGVFTIEQLSMSDYIERYITTPFFEKLSLPMVKKEWNFNYKEVNIYQLELEKSFIFPLDIGQFCDLFNSVSTIKDTTVFTQVLICKRIDNWREMAIDQYEFYMDGSMPVSNMKILNEIQKRTYGVIFKMLNFNLKREPVKEIEEKILQNGYRFECRFILFEDKQCKIFEKEMNHLLSKVRLFNKLKLIKAENKKELLKHIHERSFQFYFTNQILSEQELYSLLFNQYYGNEKQSKNRYAKLSFTKTNENHTIHNLNHFLQSAIQSMPFKERTEENIDKEILNSIQFAFERVNITKNKLKIINTFQGATLTKVQIEIPQNVNYSQIINNLKNIQAAIGNKSVSIEIGDQADTINIYLPRKSRDVIYLRNILESDKFQKYVEKSELPFVLGENTNGELLFGCLVDLKHLLISGATGSGKSVFLNNLLLSLILSVSPELLNIMIIDPKQVEFSIYKGFPQVSKIVTKPKNAVELVKSLCIEMDRRYDILSKVNARNIQQYNSQNEDKIPYIVTVIDEYADLVSVNSNVEDYIIRLSQKARASGIHLVIATQKPLSTIVTSVLKSNLPSVISFRLKTNSDYMTVFGKGIPYDLLGKGDGVAKLENQHKEFERFQTPILTSDYDEEMKIYDKLKKLFNDVKQHEEIELVKEEQPIDKLKRIIANTNETRISELQKYMGIRINEVSNLVKELVQEGWLEKQGKGYQIIISDDELSKWRDKHE